MFKGIAMLTTVILELIYDCLNLVLVGEPKTRRSFKGQSVEYAG